MKADSSNLLLSRIDSIIRFFLYVLIFWLPYSPAVVEVCVVLALILWIIKRVVMIIAGVPAAFLIPVSYLNLSIGLFIIACLFSVAGSPMRADSFENFLTKTMEWFVVYFLIIDTFKDKKHIYVAMGIFLFTAFSTALDSIYQYHISFKDIFYGREIEAGGRATAAFRTPNNLGGFLTFVIPGFFTMIFMRNQHKRLKVIGIVGFVVCAWSLILTFSRGAWTAIFIALLIGCCVYLWITQKKKWLAAFLITALVVTSMFLISGRMTYLLNKRSDTVVWRYGIWNDSLEMINDRPIFGHGINTYMRVFQQYRTDDKSDPTYAHNCFIQLTAETGLLGLTAFLFLIVRIFSESFLIVFRNIKIDKNLCLLSGGILIGVLAFLIQSVFDTHWYNLQLSVYFWYMVGVLFSINNLFKNTFMHDIKEL